MVAFFPTEPATLGHTLVVPSRHIPDIWGLDSATAAELARVIIRLAGAVKRSLSPEGLNIIQSSGKAASQTVMHLHFHIVPRWTGDAIGQIWPPTTNYTELQKDIAWNRLREEIDAERRGAS